MTTPELPERDDDYPRIAEYLMGECSPADAARIESELALDPRLRNAAALLGLALPPAASPAPLPTDAGWAQLSARIDNDERPDRQQARRTLRVASIATAAAVLLAFAYVTYRSVAPVVAAHANEHYEAPMESQRHFRLPDGSRVTLQPGARLTYRSSFFRRPRSLTLEGEARFQAHPDVEHPFEVRAGGVLAVAVGTVFTVRANPWEPTVHIAVEEGVVLAWPDTARAHSPPRTIAAGASTEVTPLTPPI